MGEAFVWACTDTHLGVAISARVFGSVDDAKADAEEAIGDTVDVEWVEESPGEWRGDWERPDGEYEGVVRISGIKVRL